jgi:hypothetical protein
MTDDIDAAVVEWARRGDREAFAEVIRQYDHGLRALAYRLPGDRDRMDDVLQEAYLRAFRALPRFRAGSASRHLALPHRVQGVHRRAQAGRAACRAAALRGLIQVAESLNSQ